jgi:serine phosphatase RsbU (regulator of sigma subunit)
MGIRLGLLLGVDGPDLLSKVNEVLLQSGLAGSFVSLFLAHVAAGGEVLHLNAGHPPPLVLGPKGPRAVEAGDSVLGPVPDARFTLRRAVLLPGEALVACSDGILERQDADGALFSAEGVAAAAAPHADGPAARILDAIYDAAIAHGQGLPWEDDATAVVVRRER